jgi:AcrR family transcriptional regulator
MSKDPIRSKVRRQEVFEAIARTMAGRRSGAITLDEAGNSIGGSKGTIYYYFKTKGEMLYQLQMYAFDLVEEAVYPILADKSVSPRERLTRLIMAHVLCICDRWQLWRALRADAALREASPAQLRLILRRVRAYEQAVSELVKEVMEIEGTSCIEPKTATRLILGNINSINGWYRKGGSLSAEELADYVIQFVFDGFLAKC